MNDRDAGLPADHSPLPSAQAGALPFVFSPGEQAAITRILRDFPEAVQALDARLRTILERLIPSCRGRLSSKADVDYLLMGLADRIVTRTIGDEPDALCTVALDLVTRHLLAQAREKFRTRVMRPF